MKKIVLFMCLVAGLISCTSENFTPQDETTANQPMQFEIKVAETAETKAVKSNWANGDKIYVFFNGLATKYLILTYDGTAWSNTSGGGTLTTSDFSGLGTKTLTAVHFPVDVTVTYGYDMFTFTKSGNLVYNYYLYQTDKAYTVDGTTVSATLQMGKPADMIQIHVANIQSKVSEYTFASPQIKPVACYSVSTAGSITEDIRQAGSRLKGVADNDGVIFAGRLTNPDESINYTFSLASNSHIYTIKRTKALTAGKMYNFPEPDNDGNWSTAHVNPTVGTGNQVDLGLSVNWAIYNVGATKKTEYGNYYAWGELQPKSNSDYDWAHYYFGESLSKYNTSDGLTTLRLEDDAAYAALGGKFRMPTKEEWNELLTQCTWTWESNFESSGVAGFKVTSTTKKDSYGNYHYIFLPVAGKSSVPSEKGSYGYYWSSSLGDYGVDRGISIYNYYQTGVHKGSTNEDRRYGMSVRPVWVR